MAWVLAKYECSNHQPCSFTFSHASAQTGSQFYPFSCFQGEEPIEKFLRILAGTPSLQTPAPLLNAEALVYKPMTRILQSQTRELIFRVYLIVQICFLLVFKATTQKESHLSRSVLQLTAICSKKTQMIHQTWSLAAPLTINW